jgi:hypothetical protein
MQQGGWNQGPPQPPAGGPGAPPRAPSAGFGALSDYGVGAPAAGGAAIVPASAASAAPTQGSFGLGFIAGFFGNVVGLALVLMIAQGPSTRRGAGIGFITSVVVGLLVMVLLFGLIVRLFR